MISLLFAAVCSWWLRLNECQVTTSTLIILVYGLRKQLYSFSVYKQAKHLEMLFGRFVYDHRLKFVTRLGKISFIKFDGMKKLPCFIIHDGV